MRQPDRVESGGACGEKISPEAEQRREKLTEYTAREWWAGQQSRDCGYCI